MPNILIIDDEKAIRNVLKEILPVKDLSVEEASDGEEGLKKFTSGSYDVVLCDIKMPKLDGIEFLQKVIESPI
jgi:two-component system nitrogen regulation response regulator NtrX